MPVLPTHLGSYVLHLFLETNQRLRIGKLGVYHLPPVTISTVVAPIIRVVCGLG